MSKSSSGHRRRYHWWQRGSGVRLRLWMAVNGTVLAILCWFVMGHVSSARPSAPAGAAASSKPAAGTKTRDAVTQPTPVIPTREQVLHPHGIYYGVATPQAPWSSEEVRQIGTETGLTPSMTEYFVKWTQDFDPKAVAAAYQHGTIPMLSWEPWGHTTTSTTGGRVTSGFFNVAQPRYRLANITRGTFDAYITRFARAVAASKAPVALRFAHEMNGTWYPWSEQVNGNRPGDYVKAWRHVHDLFQQAGATNVIWVWSPNITRPVPGIALTPLYPGDAYVDWMGVVGYGAETTPQATFGPTLQILRRISHKPIMITETGALPRVKAQWATSLFPWLQKNRDITGFVWFQKDRLSGATGNWRFDADAASLAAFRNGVTSLRPSFEAAASIMKPTSVARPQ